jgi:AICAR transformylase/IMP cyclohydrolase PurH
MAKGEKQAIISVADKDNLVELMDGLDPEWEMYGTKGTQDTYYEASGVWIPSLAEFVADELGMEVEDKEVIAKKVSEIMLVKKSIQLACLNLRQPRFEQVDESGRRVISLDIGGMNMIATAGNTGALVLTNPAEYQEALAVINSGQAIGQDFYHRFQRTANNHIADHVSAANNLR